MATNSEIALLNLESIGPTGLTGDAARAFEAWLESGPTLEAIDAARAAIASGHRLLSGAPLTLPSGLVLRYVGQRRRTSTPSSQPAGTT